MQDVGAPRWDIDRPFGYHRSLHGCQHAGFPRTLASPSCWVPCKVIRPSVAPHRYSRKSSRKVSPSSPSPLSHTTTHHNTLQHTTHCTVYHVTTSHSQPHEGKRQVRRRNAPEATNSWVSSGLDSKSSTRTRERNNYFIYGGVRDVQHTYKTYWIYNKYFIHQKDNKKGSKYQKGFYNNTLKGSSYWLRLLGGGGMPQKS